MPVRFNLEGGIDPSQANATESQVLSGSTFYAGADSDIRTGAMTNRGSVTSSLNCGSSYTIPAGYHNGSGKITANSLASQTSATAGAAHILTGKTAWVGGSKITGNMPNRGNVSGTLNCGGAYTVPAGYHAGSGRITANSLASQTSATASAGNIHSGYTAWVNGSKITGTAAVKYYWSGTGYIINNNYLQVRPGFNPTLLFGRAHLADWWYTVSLDPYDVTVSWLTKQNDHCWLNTGVARYWDGPDIPGFGGDGHSGSGNYSVTCSA